ncbi:MAG: triose-phosphate isomerase [Mogibacterium sp.]|nr:triose-phosphate isomerase [Mogibacterium sp.]
MKKFLIAGNWKMNKTMGQAVHYARELKALHLENAEQAAIIAPFTDLAALKVELEGTGIGLGAQNVHFERAGAFTGEISVEMLKEIGVDYCVIGHSERREYFAETDETVNKKIKVLLEEGITPILCVGESLEVREAGNAQAFVCGQINADFDGIPAEDVAKVVIAYEPIWAIGTGKTATPEQAEEMCGFIRGLIAGLYDEAAAADMIIQYGGSMKPSNAKELLSKPDINGGLIGGASLKVKDFAEIVRTAAEFNK